jgi:hypothetical protein
MSRVTFPDVVLLFSHLKTIQVINPDIHDLIIFNSAPSEQRHPLCSASLEYV